MNRLAFLFLMVTLLAAAVFAQETAIQSSQNSTVCTFDDGKQVSVRYTPVPYDNKSGPPVGKVWTPGDAPMYLFTEASLAIGPDTIDPGAYSIYTMPSKDNWTIIVSHNVKATAYDSNQDAGRMLAQTGKLPDKAKTLSLYFGHIAPGTCTLRIDYGNERASTEFKERK